MPKYNYKTKLSKLSARRTDPVVNKAFVTESFRTGVVPETVKYVFESMTPIDKGYTAKSYEEAERVQKQISAGLNTGISVEYDYQGSVPLNTHIKLHSDLDILTVHSSFYSLEPPLTPIVRYTGDPLKDLRDLRENVFQTLSRVYYAAKVKNSSAKAISISGGSLQRKFDIIICNWYETVDYQRTNYKHDKAINIYDKNVDARLQDHPFKHISEVEIKSSQIAGDNFKRLVRLLKNVKVDADEQINLSSFLITSVMYHMHNSRFVSNYNNSTNLLVAASEHLNSVITQEAFRKSLLSPNKKELLFAVDDRQKVVELKKLKQELDEIIRDLADELNPGVRSLYESYGLSNVSHFYEPLQKAHFNYQL